MIGLAARLAGLRHPGHRLRERGVDLRQRIRIERRDHLRQKRAERAERVGREGADEAGGDPRRLRGRQGGRDRHEGLCGALVDALHRAGAVIDPVQHRIGAVEKSLEALQGGAGIQRAQATLALARSAPPVADHAGLAAEVQANPDDHEKRFALANAQMAAGDRDGAADNLLHIVAADRTWNEDAARQQLLKLFEVVGMTDPWVSQQRRRLSAILFG